MDVKNRISVVLTSEEFDRFSAYCTEKGHKKSTLIKRLIREHLDDESYGMPTTQSNESSTSPRSLRAARARRATRKEA
jgi:hypothetical protein